MKKSLNSAWHEYKGLLAFIALMLVFRSAVADWNYVPSSSMNPTLVAGDRDIEAGTIGVKDLSSGEQVDVPADSVVAEVLSRQP